MSQHDEEQLARIARDAKVLMEAAKVLERLSDGASEIDDEELEVDTEEADMTTDEASSKLGDAADTAAALSTSMTLVLAEHGYVPDFDESLAFEEDEDDSGRAFQ